MSYSLFYYSILASSLTCCVYCVYIYIWVGVLCVCACMHKPLCVTVWMGLWTRVAVVAQSVASVCLWMTACCFSCADGRCMWRPFGHGSGPVNGTGLRQSQAWVNQLPSPHGPDWAGPVTLSPPGAWALNEIFTRLQNNHSHTGGVIG